MFSKCEAVDDLSVDCEQCGKRAHAFWQDPVGQFIDFLRRSRPFADKVNVISHNSRGYDLQFLLRRFLDLRWAPQLIVDGSKIFSMVVEYLHILDSPICQSVSRACTNHSTSHARRVLSPPLQHCQQFGLCGLSSRTQVLWADFMSDDERAQFSAWYEWVKDKILTIGRNCWPTAWTT